MNTLITFEEFEFENLLIPAFEVGENELVGLAIPADYGEQWDRLIQLLANKSRDYFKASNKVLIIPPQIIEYENIFDSQIPIKNYLVTAGLSNGIADEILEDLCIEADVSLSDLQLTPKLLIDLSIAWHNKSNIVMLSTSGLDPIGIRSVSKLIHSFNKFSAVDIISSSLIKFYESIDGYDRVIYCEFI